MSEGAPPESVVTLDTTLGFEGYDFDGEATASARMPVADVTRQPYGIVHGGALAALAESICSRATFEGTAADMLALGQSNETTFLRPISEGVVEAVARARHRGRTSWVWDVELTDGEGRLCALSRMIVAVRPIGSARLPNA